MTKKYYKVVNSNLKSVWVNTSDLVTQYKVGEWVTAKIPMLPMAVFSDLISARIFINDNALWGARIFECEIKNKTKTPWLPSTTRYPSMYFLKRILRRMQSKHIFMDLVTKLLPGGTVTCKKVKLIREITY